jgi:hypothetical protein
MESGSDLHPFFSNQWLHMLKSIRRKKWCFLSKILSRVWDKMSLNCSWLNFKCHLFFNLC